MGSEKKKENDRASIDSSFANNQYDGLSDATDFGASFLISGLLAATFKTSIAPFERIKLILQTQANSQQMQMTNKTAYTGFVDAAIRIPKEQGFLSLWRGNFTNICRYFPSQAINFSLYDVYYRALVRVLRPSTSRGHDVISFLAGGSVGVTSCSLLYPLSFCTTRISVDVGDGKYIKREFGNLSDCLRKVYRNDGIRGFYRGLPCSAAGVFLYRSTYFGLYTTGKRAYVGEYTYDPRSSIISVPFLVSLALAQVTTMASTLISYPLDTISRQSMLWSGRGLARQVPIREVISKILRTEGPLGLYRGVFANMLTAVCGSLVLVTYDIVTEYYRKSGEVKEQDT